MQQIIHRGTSLLILPIDVGIAVAADDLAYRNVDGVAVPACTNVQKLFIAAENITPKGSAPESSPEEVAARIYDKARQTFQPIDSLIREGKWNKQRPGETFVNYLIVGYAKDFGSHSLFNINIKLDANGKGLNFSTPENHATQFRQLSWYGEDEHIIIAREGFNPEAALFKRKRIECRDTIQALLPELNPPLQESVACIAGLIKVEAYFNKNKVGRAVNVVVIDRKARRSYSATI